MSKQERSYILRTSLLSTRLCWINGYGNSYQKGTIFGSSHYNWDIWKLQNHGMKHMYKGITQYVNRLKKTRDEKNNLKCLIKVYI